MYLKMDPFTLVWMSWGQLGVQSWFDHQPVRSGRITPNVVYICFFSVQMIVSLSGEIKPLALRQSFIVSSKGTK